MTIPTGLLNATKEMFTSDTRQAVRKLSEIYDFPFEDAMSKLSLGEAKKPRHSPKTKNEPKAKNVPKAKNEPKAKSEPKAKTKSSIALPWCGTIVHANCYGVRFNKGLFTQCTNKIKSGTRCSACSDSSKRMICCGDIRERSDDNWSDSKGRTPVRYCVVMQKLGITREEAEAEAKRLGWVIPNKEFEKPEPARRGRPPKRKPLVSNVVGNDMLDELVAGARDLSLIDESPRERPIPPNETREQKMHRLFGSDSDSDDEAYDVDTQSDDEIEVRPTVPLVIEGKEYLFDEKTNTAYYLDTQALAGVTTPGRRHWRTE